MASITSWVRLEPRARDPELGPGVEARLHDPLWMIGRQWQLGELTGHDAGSAIETRANTVSRISGGAARIGRYTVAGTLREREYLRRQVRALTAEGRMSAWVLGALPPLFFVYLFLTQPDYLNPMFSTPIGWMMLGTAGVMMAIGVFAMSKLVVVEV